jgi:hypothetical protein
MCFHSSPTIVRVIKSRIMRWALHVARVGERRDVYRVWVGKPEGKRQLGRPRRRWENNIKLDLQKVAVAYPGILFGGGGCSANIVEDRGQRERGSGGGSPLVRGSAKFANE